MLRRVFLLMCLLGCLGILFFPGCKTTDDASSYTLTVTLGEGVSGTPAAGSHSYAENDTVSYSYSAQAGYGNLAVTLDGTPLANSGSITITGNHILNATADIDIRGKWTGTFFEPGGDDAYLEVTFSGGILSGTTSGQFDFKAATGNGEFNVSGNQVEFILRYSDDSSLSCTATITDVNNMNGNWEFRSPWGFDKDGTFTLQREL
jgi:hypothetical protein